MMLVRATFVCAALLALSITERVSAHDARLPVWRVHDAPAGWTYPFSCCSGVDCREVPADWIDESGSGYRIRMTGELIAADDARLKESPDGRFHWCSVAGDDDSRTICLFAPPRGF